MNNNKEIDALLDSFIASTDRVVSNIVGVPLLACRIAQNAVIIKNDPNIKTTKQVNDFLIKDLTTYSKKLKSENCVGYMFIDSYTENLKNTIYLEVK